MELEGRIACLSTEAWRLSNFWAFRRLWTETQLSHRHMGWPRITSSLPSPPRMLKGAEGEISEGHSYLSFLEWTVEVPTSWVWKLGRKGWLGCCWLQCC